MMKRVIKHVILGGLIVPMKGLGALKRVMESVSECSQFFSLLHENILTRKVPN